MKKLLFPLSTLAFLTACASDSPDWSTKCEQNYSLSSYEVKACLAKVNKGQATDVQSNEVSLDPNPDRPEETLGRNTGTRSK
jgi:hypothetical protein